MTGAAVFKVGQRSPGDLAQDNWKVYYFRINVHEWGEKTTCSYHNPKAYTLCQDLNSVCCRHGVHSMSH